MLAKKCPKCCAVWYTALPKCAFCGVEGEEVPTSTHTGRLPEKAAPEAQPEPEKRAADVAVAEATPVPVTHADPEPTPLPPVKVETPLPAPVGTLEPLKEKRPDPSTLPAAPRVPSSKVPLVLGLLGVAACAVLPVAMLVVSSRVAVILANLAVSVLLPFAPLAWFAGHRYENRCIDLGFRPSRLGRSGRLLGMVVTILITLEGSVLAFLAALSRISAGK